MRAIQLTIFGIILSWGSTFAQQEPSYSQYMINPFTINPAISSTEDYIDLQSGYRRQWSQLSGSPQTFYLSGHATIGKPFYQYHYKAEHKNWHGIGFQITEDRIGPQRRNTFLIAYSYNIALTRKMRLALGAFIGFKQLRIDHTHWQNIEDQTDELFLSDLNTGAQPEIQLGGVLYNEGDYYVSFSIQNLVGNQLNFNSFSSDLTTGKIQLHSYFTAGKIMNLNDKWTLTPSTMIRYVPNTSFVADISGKLDFQNKYWTGLSIRTSGALGVIAGTNVAERFDITFAYEHALSLLNRYQTGTYEFILGLRLDHPQMVLDPSQFWE